MQDPNKRKQLYSFLKDNDLVKTDFETFSAKYTTEESTSQLYAFLQDNKLTTKNQSDFYNDYFGDLKKKEDSTPQNTELATEQEGTISGSDLLKNESNKKEPAKEINYPTAAEIKKQTGWNDEQLKENQERFKNTPKGTLRDSNTVFEKENYTQQDRTGLDFDNKAERVDIDGFDNEKMNNLTVKFKEQAILSEDEIRNIDADIDRKKRGDFTFGEKLKMQVKKRASLIGDVFGFKSEKDLKTISKDDRDEIIKKRIQEKQEEFIENLPEEDKKTFQSYLPKRDKELSKKYKEAEFINTHIEKFVLPKEMKSLKGIDNEIKELADKPKEQITKEDEDNYNTLIKQRKERVNVIKGIQNQYKINRKTQIDSTDDLLTFEDEIDLVKRDYGFWRNYISPIAEGFLNLAIDSSLFAGNLLNEAVINNAGEEDFLVDIRNKIQEYSKLQAEAKENFANTIKKRKTVEDIDSVGDFAEYTGRLVSEQISVLGTIYATGGLGLGITASSSGGDRLGQLQLERERGENNYTDAQINGNALMYASGEYIGEKITLGILNDYKKVFKSINASKTLKNSFKENLKQFSNNLVKGVSTANKEGLSEVYTELIQWSGDKLIGEDRKIEFLETYVSGFVIGKGIHVTSGITNWAVGQYSKSENRKKVKENTLKILESQKIIEEGNLSNEVKSLYQEKIQTLTNENNSLINESVKDIQKLNPKQVTEVTKINNKIRAIQVTLQKGNVSENIKKSLLSEIKSLHEQKQEILSLNTNNKKTIEENSEPKTPIKKTVNEQTEKTAEKTEKPKVETTTPETEVKQEDVKPLETELESEVIKTQSNKETQPQQEVSDDKVNISESESNKNEKKTQGDTSTDKNLQSGTTINQQQGKSENIQPTINNTTSKKPIEVKELSEDQKKQNALVDAKNEYNKLSPSKKRGKEGIALRSKITNLAKDFGFKVSENKGKINVKRKNGKSVGKISFKEQLPDPTKSDIHNAKVLIDAGFAIVGKDGRMELDLDAHDMKKGVADIEAGKTNTVPAKRLIAELKRVKEQGGVGFKQTAGKQSQRTFVPITQEEIDNFVPTEEETRLLAEQQAELAKEYEDYLNTLDDKTINEIYEDKTRKSGLAEKKPNTRGKGKSNVVSEKETTSPEKKELDKQIEQAESDVKKAKTALENKAKQLDKKINEDQEDLFGERKSKQDNLLFDERADLSKRNEATAQERQALKDAQQKLKELKSKKDNLKETTQEIDFDEKSESKPTEGKIDDDIQAQGITLSKENNRDSALSDEGAVKQKNARQRKFKRFWNNTFSSKRDLDNKVVRVIEDLFGNLSAINESLRYEASQYEKISKQIKQKYAKDYNSKLKSINDYLSGNTNVDLSFLTNEQRNNLDAFRGRVDNLSDKIISKLKDRKKRLKNDEAISRVDALIETIENNKGNYLFRQYDAFSNPDYIEALTSKYPNVSAKRRLNNAIDFVANEQGISREEAKTQILTYLDNLKDSGSYVGASTSGKAKAPFLKKRKDIPQEIRELLGESKDPVKNYIATVHNMSNYIANLEYQSKMAETLEDLGLVSDTMKEGYTRLVKSTEGWDLLQDIYVPNEVAEGIKDLQPLDSVKEPFMRFLVRLSSFTKVGKTVLSPITMSRNFLSGVFLSLNNGVNPMFNPKLFIQGIAHSWGTKKTNTQLRSENQRLIKLGIIKDGAVSREVLGILNDAKLPIDQILSKNILNKFLDVMQKLYAMGDDAYKVVGFYVWEGRYKKAGYTQQQAEDMAVDRVRNGFPTYSKIPKNIQKLRRIPFVGTFPSFTYEVFRTNFNNIKFIGQDLKTAFNKGVSKEKRRGHAKMAYHQISGMAVATATAFALSELSKSLFGISDEEDETTRNMSSPWQKDSKNIYVGKMGNNYEVVDATAFFPQETILKPLRILTEQREGRNIDDKIVLSALSAANAFFSTDIFIKTVEELHMNKNGYGTEIYAGKNLIEGISNNPEKITNYILKQAGPGIYNNIGEFARANNIAPEFFGEKETSYKEYTNTEALMALVGIRLSRINYANGIKSIGFDAKDEYQDARKNVLSIVKSSRKLNEEDIKIAFDDYKANNIEVHKKILLAVNGAKKQGMNPETIKKTLKGAGYSNADIKAIQKGRTPELKEISKTSLNNKINSIEIGRFSNDKKKVDSEIKNVRDKAKFLNDLIKKYNRNKKAVNTKKY